MASYMCGNALQKLTKLKHDQLKILTEKLLYSSTSARRSILAKLHSGSLSLSSPRVVKGHSSEERADSPVERSSSVSNSARRQIKASRGDVDFAEDKSPITDPEEKILSFKFGSVRVDAHNLITQHGQYEDHTSLQDFPRRNQSSLRQRSRTNGLDETSSSAPHYAIQYNQVSEKAKDEKLHNPSISYIDDQYFSPSSGKYHDPREKANLTRESANQPSSFATTQQSDSCTAVHKHSNYIDEQYFGELIHTSLNIKHEDFQQTAHVTKESTEAVPNSSHTQFSTHRYKSESTGFIGNQNLSKLNCHFASVNRGSHITDARKREDSPFLLELNSRSDVQEARNSETDPFHIEYVSSNSTDSGSSHFQSLPDGDFNKVMNVKKEHNDENYSDKQGLNFIKSRNNEKHQKTNGSERPKFKNNSSNANLPSEQLKSKYGTKQEHSELSESTEQEKAVRKLLKKAIKNVRTPLNGKDTVNEKLSARGSESAFDFVMRKRREAKPGTANVSHSKDEGKSPEALKDGHKILKNQVQDLRFLSKDVLLHILKSSIIYNANGIVAFNKLYGMACYGDESTVVGRSMTPFLEDLARHLEPENPQAKLYPIHRLDRDTTGVHLFATSQKMARMLHDMFKERKIEKTYWAITRGVPNPREGVINIPIMEGHVDDKERMVLFPELNPELRKLKRLRGHASSASTYYKTLKAVDNAALLEVAPETGVKHQVRVHLGFGLNCAVLGDHKYSDLRNMAPQKLSGDMLDKLNIRQSKVRNVPLHLHAKRIVIPHVLEGESIVINAQLPSHFVDNLKALGLRYK